uniref:Integrin subunit alpha 9 n=1 Tax=Rousettus aegyptiacus TaxID=9407 RepID=A0A7J8HRA6_ROUAE|nr:integrin subunit alpha 9 [Rousettus aegyptiacus]
MGAPGSFYWAGTVKVLNLTDNTYFKLNVTIGAFMSDSVVLLRARPVITVVSSIFLPASINITAPQCHDGQQPVNCLNVTACFSFHGRHVPGEIGLNYVLTADVAKKEKSQLPRVYFVLHGESVGQVSEKLHLVHMEETCHHYAAHVKVVQEEQ